MVELESTLRPVSFSVSKCKCLLPLSWTWLLEAEIKLKNGLGHN